MKRLRVAATAVVAAALLGGCAHMQGSGPSRQQEVARKGSVVMPFDLMRTTHFFDDNATGGIETITANDHADAEQVALIRGHLSKEAGRFGRGDFSDPARIHGTDMPGMAALAAAGSRLQVTYREMPGGASLTFASQDPGVVASVHQWFAAQRSDHAAHMHMHMQGQMHEQMHEQMHW